jgi:hypothetical protein
VLNGTGRQLTVPAGPAVQHVRDLIDNGAEQQLVAAAASCDRWTIFDLYAGNLTRIRRTTEVRVLAVRLADVLGRRRAVPACGATRRVRALMAMGHSTATIATASGVSECFLRKLARGDLATVRAETAGRVSSAYRPLVGTAGSSTVAQARARREGWAGPLHWDDAAIDDPDGYPDWTGACGELVGYYRHVQNPNLPPPCPPCKAARAGTARQTRANSQLAA